MGWEIVVSLLESFISFFRKNGEAKSKKILEKKHSSLTPMLIASISRDAPEFNRKQIEKSFKGIKIMWNVKFMFIVDRKFFGRKGTVMTVYNGNELYWVNVKLFFNDFPEIKIAQKNDNFLVTGTINLVEGNSVYIKPIAIEKKEWFVV